MICNVSRTILSLARQRYAFVTVVLVTAPRELLKARLSTRARASDASLVDRIARSARLEVDADIDVEIQNVGRVETVSCAIRNFHRILSRCPGAGSGVLDGYLRVDSRGATVPAGFQVEENNPKVPFNNILT